MAVGIERVERQRQAPHAASAQARRQVRGDAHAVGADDDPQPRSAARRTISRMSRRSSGSPPVRMVRHSGANAGDLVDDPEAALGVELAPIGEAVGVDQRRAAGVEIAVLAGQVAAVGEVPGDDVGPGEASRHGPVDGERRLTCRSGRGPRRGPRRRLQASPARGRSVSMPVRAIGPHELGDVREPRLGRRRPRTGRPGVRRTLAGAILARHHRGEGAARLRGRSARLASPRADASAGPIRTPSDCTTCVSYGVGQHRHLVAALGARVDDRERAALGRTDGLQLHRAVARDAEELHRGLPVDSRLSEELLRDLRQGTADGAARARGERDPPIAVPGQLGIERHGPEAGDLRGLADSGAAKSGRIAPQPRQ